MDYTEGMINAVWAKGQIVADNDPNLWRQDQCGAWIARAMYGDRNSQYGWEIDHIIPVSRGGGEALANLRPLQWLNNASRQDGRLVCIVTAEGVHNVQQRKATTV